MKKHCCILFAVVFVLGLLMVTTNAQATEVEVPKIKLSGLIEVGGVWQDLDFEAAAPDKEDDSDLCLTTVELTAEAELNEWVNVVAVLLYEDFTFEWAGEPGETDVEIDEAMVTIGNTEEFPVYVAAGKMYVPFGALLTYFPDDPLYDGPLTLLFGETLEKAVLVGVEHKGFSVSAYAFNGDMDKYAEDENVESFGVDANFSFEDEEAGFDLLVGASYISNVADADYLGERMELSIEDGGPIEREIIAKNAAVPLTAANIVVHGIDDYPQGVACYAHVGLAGFFIDGEYMTAIEEWEYAVTISGTATLDGSHVFKSADQPSVWNFEGGYNLDWGKPLQIVLQYAASSEAENLGFPQSRYGICLNQELFEDVVLSVGYLRDKYESDDFYIHRHDGNHYERDDRNLAFAQIAIEF